MGASLLALAKSIYYAGIPSLDFYQRKAENDKRQIYHISSNHLLYTLRGTTRHLLLR